MFLRPFGSKRAELESYVFKISYHVSSISSSQELATVIVNVG